MANPRKDADDIFAEGLMRSVERFQLLAEQNKKNLTEMLKHRQYMTATVQLLSDETREAWQALIESILEEADTSSAATLTEAIKETLRVRYPEWLTVANVRDQLVAVGFDFSSYKSNELASVSTTLRRMQPDLEVDNSGETVRYRLRPSGLPKSAEQVRQALESIRQGTKPKFMGRFRMQGDKLVPIVDSKEK